MGPAGSSVLSPCGHSLASPPTPPAPAGPAWLDPVPHAPQTTINLCSRRAPVRARGLSPLRVPSPTPIWTPRGGPRWGLPLCPLSARGTLTWALPPARWPPRLTLAQPGIVEDCAQGCPLCRWGNRGSGSPGAHSCHQGACSRMRPHNPRVAPQGALLTCISGAGPGDTARRQLREKNETGGRLSH